MHFILQQITALQISQLHFKADLFAQLLKLVLKEFLKIHHTSCHYMYEVQYFYRNRQNGNKSNTLLDGIPLHKRLDALKLFMDYFHIYVITADDLF